MKKTANNRYVASQEKRSRIYAAAIALFREYGYDETSIQDISSAADISVGSIYNFYGSKLGIIRQASYEAEQYFLTSLQLTADHIAAPAASIRAAFTSLSHYIERELGRSIAKRFRDVRDEDRFLAPEQHMWHRLRGSLVAFLTAAQKAGTVAGSVSPAAAADYILSFFHGCMINWTWQQFGMNDSLSAGVAEFFSTLLYFLEGKPHDKA